MINRKKKTNLNYRKKLIQLAKFYKIVEIKNYFKSSKILTNAQLELILIKNKIKLPIKKRLSKLEYLITLKDKFLQKFLYISAAAILIIVFFGRAPNLVDDYYKIDSRSNQAKVKTLKKSKDSLAKILNQNKFQLNEKDQDENFSEALILKNDPIENKVSLKSSVVSALFEDHKYDLSQIRKGKKVKPFYISLLPKDMSLIKGVKKRKELFIKIILPLILQENNKIKNDRKKLFKILAKNSNSKEDKNWLKWKFKQYKIKNADISELKLRMDIIPPSIAISQAAIESGWGTSRFALEGNALYGQWTYSEKGLKPLDAENTNHKVMQFKILTASVQAYKKNLNTHKGYKLFRQARAELRNKKEKITGLKLTKYLESYAENGQEYIKKIEKTIEQNALVEFEDAELFSIGLRKGIRL